MRPIKMLRMRTAPNYKTSVNFLGSLVDTNAGSISLGITPQVSSLVVVFNYFTGAVSGAVTDDIFGGAYTKVAAIGSGGWYIRNSSIISGGTHTVSATPNTASTGRCMIAFEIIGMSKAGATALANGTTSTFIAGGTPSVTVGAQPAINPALYAVVCSTNPPALTPASGFIEHADTGYDTPIWGVEVASKGGNSPSTITSGNSCATSGTILSLVLDAS